MRCHEEDGMSCRVVSSHFGFIEESTTAVLPSRGCTDSIAASIVVHLLSGVAAVSNFVNATRHFSTVLPEGREVEVASIVVST